ncbi:MAG: hypothetical protein H5T71_03255 [Chloroflexi bacterium]|nr:hypothetical protein [Chloroflexota bacterium]
MTRTLYNPTDRALGYWWNGDWYEVPAGKEVKVEDDFLAYHLLAHQPALVDTTNAPLAKAEEKPSRGRRKK